MSEMGNGVKCKELDVPEIISSGGGFITKGLAEASTMIRNVGDTKLDQVKEANRHSEESIKESNHHSLEMTREDNAQHFRQMELEASIRDKEASRHDLALRYKC